jgi:lipopolysaccharide assembly outer membrane protein LptD (OstA)
MKNFYIFLIILMALSLTDRAWAIIGEKDDLLGGNVDVKILAQNFSGEANSNEFHIWGSVCLEKDEATLEADDIKFNGKTNIAVASGNVVFSQPGTVLSGNTVTVEYKEKKGIWAGNVKVVQTKAPEKGMTSVQKTFKDGPVTIVSDTLEFTWQEPGRVVAGGRVEVYQKDKHVYADSATYISSPQSITLDGNVKLRRDDGSSMICAKLVMDLKQNTFQAMRSSNSQIKVDYYFNEKKK